MTTSQSPRIKFNNDPLKVRCKSCRKIYDEHYKDAEKRVLKYARNPKYYGVDTFEFIVKIVQDVSVEKQVCIDALREEIQRLKKELTEK